MSGGGAGPQRVALQDLEKGLPSPRQPVLPLIGLQLARYVVWLIVLILGLIALYAWLTAPTVPLLRTLVPEGSGREYLSPYNDLRAVWHKEIVEFAQLLVAPLLPVLATVIGHIFGREQR